MNLSDQIAEYLAAGSLMQVCSTSTSGRPWLSHVWYAATPDSRRLFFTSNEARRHSAEIRATGTVAGGVVAIPLDGLGQKVQGLTFEGQAEELAGTVSADAYECYAQRWPQVRQMFSASDIELGATPMRMYGIEVRRFVLFDEVNYPQQPRQELIFDGDG